MYKFYEVWRVGWVLKQDVLTWVFDLTLNIIENMSFHRREQEAISEDQKDNDTIKQIIDRHNKIKRELDEAKHQLEEATVNNSALAEENKSLKAQQKMLKEQLAVQLKESSQDWGTKTIGGRANLKINGEIFASSQQTKRRSINGFVNDLTLDMEKQEDAFKRERRMLAEARRELQLRNEEVCMLRNTVRQLQTELSVVSKHNVHLATMATPPNNTFLLNCDTFDSEMGRMDQLYRMMQIEVDLALQ